MKLVVREGRVMGAKGSPGDSRRRRVVATNGLAEGRHLLGLPTKMNRLSPYRDIGNRPEIQLWSTQLGS